MSQNEMIKQINNLVHIAEHIADAGDNRHVHNEYSLSGLKDIKFTGEQKLKIYQDTLEKIFNSDKEIAESCTIKSFDNELIQLVKRLKNLNQKCAAVDIKNLLNKFYNLNLQECEILYEFHGVIMGQDSIKFGDFTVYNYAKSIDKLITKCSLLGKMEHHFNTEYIVGIKVKARERDKAIEIADALCSTFENVFNYTIGDLSHRNEVGIFNFAAWRSRNRAICGNNWGGLSTTNNILKKVNIGDPFFKDKSEGHDRIWALITKEGKTTVENRIINSIEWIGKGVSETDPTKAIVQFVFAIEGMLEYNGGKFLTPSLVSRLSDWMAFIIHDELEGRKKIAKFFSDTYSRRSAIAHGANKKIDLDHLGIAKQLAKLLIRTFLVTKPFNEMSKIEELSDYIEELKFK